MTTLLVSLRDRLYRFVPSWLSDSSPNGPSWGFKFIFTLVRFLDAGIGIALQASLAAVARGTPTALKYVGDARGIVRGRLDTDASYATKLSTWIQRWKEAGSQMRLAREIWEYLGDSRVRIVNRSGHWITIDVDGTTTETDASWDWDSVSNPERNDPAAPWWSDEWVIIYPTYPIRPGTLGGMTGEDGFGLGHLCPHQQVDDLKVIIDRFKGCHSCVRAVIWTTSATRFDPAVGGSKPNGNWGDWGVLDGSNHKVPSDRDLTECRYWEPR